MTDLLLWLCDMEEMQPSNASKPSSLREISFPNGPDPLPHPVKFHDPRDVAQHFASLNVDLPSAGERWARKVNAQPFRGV